MVPDAPHVANGSTTETVDLLHRADHQSRYAAVALASAMPADTVLYLLLPMYGAAFGVSLTEAGLLLAANRLVRIAGYGWVARLYAQHGDRPTSTAAVLAASVCALGYATLSGFWALLPLRLLWGLAFASLNLSAQVLSTSQAAGSAARSGRSRAWIAIGPMLALPCAAVLSRWTGPRYVFAALTLIALLVGLWATRRLPREPHSRVHAPRARPRRPDSLELWSFLEGFTLDGLFIIGLTVLGQQLMPDGAALAAGMLLATRYGAEIILSPVGGRLAERWGPERLLVSLSLLTAVTLVGFGQGWLWSCGAGILILRALQLPLLPPIVALRYSGPERVRALATRSVWRDIGAGLGPIAAAALLPIVPAAWLYSCAAGLLALTAGEVGLQASRIGYR